MQHAAYPRRRPSLPPTLSGTWLNRQWGSETSALASQWHIYMVDKTIAVQIPLAIESSLAHACAMGTGRRDRRTITPWRRQALAASIALAAASIACMYPTLAISGVAHELSAPEQWPPQASTRITSRATRACSEVMLYGCTPQAPRGSVTTVLTAAPYAIAASAQKHAQAVNLSWRTMLTLSDVLLQNLERSSRQPNASLARQAPAVRRRKKS